jgi:hypothetical protein
LAASSFSNLPDRTSSIGEGPSPASPDKLLALADEVIE